MTGNHSSRNSVKGYRRQRFTRPARWLAHTARWLATRLCAYLPVTQEMSFLPQALVNALALLTVLLMLLPSNTNHSQHKQHVAGRRPRVHRIRVRGTVRRRSGASLRSR